MWSEEEARQITALCGRADPLTDALAIAARAVELVAARGGTMTAKGLADLWRHFEINGDSHPAERIRQHIAAQGARVAALEAELEKHRNPRCQRQECARERERADRLETALADRSTSYQQALKEAEGLSATLTEACRKADEQRERAEAAEGALAAERTGDAQMKRDFGARPNETLRGLVARFRDERDAATQLAARRLNGRMEAASEAERLRAERDAWRQRAEDAESRLQRMRDGISDMVQRCVEMAKVVGEPCPAHGDSTRCVQPAGHNGDHVFLPVRYPCSPTCTHDDAATLGHPERVRALSAKMRSLSLKTPMDVTERVSGRSEAFVSSTTEENPSTEAYGAGVEAMRAACLRDVVGILQREGFSEGLLASQLKAAIEGATP